MILSPYISLSHAHDRCDSWPAAQCTECSSKGLHENCLGHVAEAAETFRTWNLAGCCICTARRVSAKYRNGSAVSKASESSSSSVHSSSESLSSCRRPCKHHTLHFKNTS